MSFGRRLGIDYGQVRVGLAICDNEGLVATPLTTLKNDKSLFSNLENIIAENNVVGIFLGKPKHLSGVEGATVELVSGFAQRCSETFELPITFVDERLTSGGAEKLLKAAGKNSKEQRFLVDQLAAVAILELGIQIEKRN
ncbi:MAG: Holliday junction resolvase RuvX [Candidatus Nanopelagicaceae bacterium]|jgi:putative holliday junction resolvase